MRCLFLFIFTFFTGVYTFGQEPLVVNVALMPPYPNYVDELVNLGDEAIITIQNTDFQNGYDLKLGLTVDGSNGITLSTRIESMPLQPISIGPGETLIITGFELNNFYNNYTADDIDYSGITLEEVINNQSLPDGVYTVCVRAYGYTTMEPLSSSAPMGCANPFTVVAIDPPMITYPVNQQIVQAVEPQYLNFTWFPVTAAIPDLRYRLEIMEINEEMINMYDAFSSPNFLFFQEDGLISNTFLYGAEHPAFVPGGKYAVRVRAYREEGMLNINNQGLSDIVMFTYGEPEYGDGLPGDSIVITQTFPIEDLPDQNFDCGTSCNAPTPGVSTGTITTGDVIHIGNFEMYVSGISGSESYSGSGIIQPTEYLPVGIKVTFENLRVDLNKRVKTGIAKAVIREDSWVNQTWSDVTGYIENVSFPTSGLNDAWETATDPQFYLENLSGLYQQTGTTLPFSMGEDEHRLQVVGMEFFPERAAFNLSYFQKIHDDVKGEKILSFVGRNLCITPGGPALSQDEAVLELTSDLRFTLDNKTSLTFLASTNENNGTRVLFDCDGFTGVDAKGIARLDPSVLVAVDAQGNQIADTVTVPFLASYTNWNDWFATLDFTNEVNSASYFRYPQLEHYDFRLQYAVIDHSIDRNASEMTFPEFYTGTRSVEWRGIYIKEVTMLLPRFIKSNVEEDERTRLAGHDLIIDPNGFTGKLEGENILSPQDGSLGSWNFSIDNIVVEINQNQLHNAEMQGGLKIPILDEPLSYLADIEYTPFTGTSHTFILETTGEYEIPIWFAEATFAPNSGVSINVSNNVPTIEAKLHGILSFADVIGDIDKNNLTNIEFNDLVVRNRKTADGGYISIGDIGTGLTATTLAVAGFGAAINQLSWNESDLTNAALVLGLGLDLTGENGSISGGTVLRLKSKIEEYADSVSFVYNGTAISGITIAAELGAVNISGTIEYFKDDPKFGSGFDGNVHLDFLEKISIDGDILFGNVKQANNSFCYFYTYGLVMLTGSPIPFATPVDIYGFGGGVYFNMAVNQEMDDPSQMGGTQVNAREVFTPQQGILGLQASVVLGLTPSTQTFNADATLTAEINFNTWGLNAIYIAGSGYIMQKINEVDKDEAMVKANVLISYDFPNNTLVANAGLLAQVPKNSPMLEITGEINVYRSPNLWYLKAGVPQTPLSAALEVGPLNVGATAYFMTGQQLPPPILPNKVKKFFKVQNTMLENNMSNSLGIGFMAGVHFDINYNFTILGSGLYLGVLAGADISLMHWYAAQCNGSTDFGINKWYAMGQAYILGEAAFSLLGVELAGVGIGVLLEGAFPNPMGFKGIIAGYAKVLGVSEQFSFNFKVGNMCNMEPLDVEDLIAAGEYHRPDLELETIEMIGAITPQNASLGVSTQVRPTIQWLVDDGETREYTYGSGFGELVHKTYKFQVSKWWRMENEHGGWEHVDFASTHNDQTKVTTLKPVNNQGVEALIAGFRRYKVSAQVEILEKISNTQWEPLTYLSGLKAGEPVMEIKDHIFTTSTNLTEISPIHVDYTFPYERQRFYPYEHLENGQFKFNVDHTAKFEDFKDCGFKIYADFKPLEGAEVQRVEVDWQYLLRIYYEMPNLNPSTIYQVKILAERDITPSELAAETVERCKIENESVAAIFEQITGVSLDWKEKQNHINMNDFNISNNYPGLHTGGFINSSGDNLGGNATAEETPIKQTKELYTLYFRTSMYPTIHAKLQATTVVNIENETSSLVVNGTLHSFKRYKVKIKNGEGFDRYDILGHDSTEVAGITNGYFQARGVHKYNYNQLSGNVFNWYDYAFNGIYNFSVIGLNPNAPPGAGGTGQHNSQFQQAQVLAAAMNASLNKRPQIVKMPAVPDLSNQAGLKHVKPLLNDFELGLAEPLYLIDPAIGSNPIPGLYSGPFLNGSQNGDGNASAQLSGNQNPDFNAMNWNNNGAVNMSQSIANQASPNLFFNNGFNIPSLDMIGNEQEIHLELDINFDRNAFDARTEGIQLYNQNPYLLTVPPSVLAPYIHMPPGTYRLELMSTHNLPDNFSEASLSKFIDITLD